MNRHLFILNPAAGTKNRTERIRAVIEKLKIKDPYDIFVTDGVRAAETETERYLREHSEDFVRVYACGGDGTLSEVANGVYKSGSKNCAIAIVPVGSGNDFVKSLDIPPEHFRNIKGLIDGDIVEIDLLLAKDAENNERVSLNIISAGFDAAVAFGQEKFKKLPLVSGSMAYNLSLVKCVFTDTKNYFALMVDGEKYGKSEGPYLFAIAANGKYYGGGFKASPYSDISDGMLDFIRIKTVSKTRLLSLVGKFREGKHIDEYKDITSYTQCKSMQFLSENTININVDGEIAPMKNPIIKILPKAVKLVLPKTEKE